MKARNLQILKETIDEKKNGVIKEETKTNTIINVDGYIPNKFESNDLEKIDLYKKIDALSSLDSIINFSNEILDLYGKTPDNVKLLLEKKRLEVLSDILYLKNINDTKLFIELTLNENMIIIIIVFITSIISFSYLFYQIIKKL